MSAVDRWFECGFTGTLDGNGFTIIDLHIDRSEDENVGLFASAWAAGEVQNVRLVDGYVRGKKNVGAIAGSNSRTIRDSYNAGEVQGVHGFGP